MTRVIRFIDGMRARPYKRGVRCGGGAGAVPRARMPVGRESCRKIGVGAASSVPF